MTDTYFGAMPISFAASDGYLLRGFCWRHTTTNVQRAVVLINPATSVRCHYYAYFAAFLYRNGFDVITYDYRGIGGSRYSNLKGFEAGWIDWGRLDVEAAIQYAHSTFPVQPIQIVAHSVGGALIGLAESNHLISRVFLMGAQYAYWRDYHPRTRIRMLVKWHVLMPFLAAVFGYFPGKRLGWLEDTPKAVVRDWTARCQRFEDTWKSGSIRLGEKERIQLVERFNAMSGEILALSLSDDEFGTVNAIRRLLGYYLNSSRTHLHISPGAIGYEEIGHFAFFHSRFENDLWKIPLAWLRDGELIAGIEGDVLALAPAVEAQPM